MSIDSRAGFGYRPYCDLCGHRLWDHPLTLHQARNVARHHAADVRHQVRIEPWDSYALIEHVDPPEPQSTGARRSGGL